MNTHTQIGFECISCIFNNYINKVPADVPEADKLAYAKSMLGIISSSDSDTSAPEIVAGITELKNKMFGFIDDFSHLKSYFNRLMLTHEGMYCDYINSSDNALLTAVKFAMLGNYIDFGALDSIEDEKLLGIPSDSEKLTLDMLKFDKFRCELESAERLLYITDNCGEIVMDKLLIKTIKSLYPNLDIEILVRGAAVLNDATVDDAAFVGLNALAPIYGNGTSIAGTCIKRLPDDIKSKLYNADIIISKGQGNFETLNHCGLNVYYLFLCKCGLFANRFGVPKYTGMFINDSDLE